MLKVVSDSQEPCLLDAHQPKPERARARDHRQSGTEVVRTNQGIPSSAATKRCHHCKDSHPTGLTESVPGGNDHVCVQRSPQKPKQVMLLSQTQPPNRECMSTMTVSKRLMDCVKKTHRCPNRHHTAGISIARAAAQRTAVDQTTLEVQQHFQP